MHKFNPNLCGESRNLNLTRTQSAPLASRGRGKILKSRGGAPLTPSATPLRISRIMHPDAKLYPWNFIETYKIKFITKFIAREIYAVISVFLGAGRGPIARSHFSQDAASAAPHCSARPQTPPNPPMTLAIRTASKHFYLTACATYFDFKIPRCKILNLVVEFHIREIIKFYSQTMRGVLSGF